MGNRSRTKGRDSTFPASLQRRLKIGPVRAVLEGTRQRGPNFLPLNNKSTQGARIRGPTQREAHGRPMPPRENRGLGVPDGVRAQRDLSERGGRAGRGPGMSFPEDKGLTHGQGTEGSCLPIRAGHGRTPRASSPPPRSLCEGRARGTTTRPHWPTHGCGRGRGTSQHHACSLLRTPTPRGALLPSHDTQEVTSAQGGQ